MSFGFFESLVLGGQQKHKKNIIFNKYLKILINIEQNKNLIFDNKKSKYAFWAFPANQKILKKAGGCVKMRNMALTETNQYFLLFFFN